MTVDDLVATIELKMNQAKADFDRVRELSQMGKANAIRVSYHNGLYDGLERAWREAVFAKMEMEKANEQTETHAWTVEARYLEWMAKSYTRKMVRNGTSA